MEHEKMAKSYEFYNRSWTFYQFCHELNLFFTTTKKLSIDVKSLHFQTFLAKHRECKIGKRDGHGKSRNGPRKVKEKYFVKPVGTLYKKESWSIPSTCLCFFQVIVRKDGKIRLYCKGADNIIFDRCGTESNNLKELTSSHLNVSPLYSIIQWISSTWNLSFHLTICIQTMLHEIDMTQSRSSDSNELFFWFFFKFKFSILGY